MLPLPDFLSLFLNTLLLVQLPAPAQSPSGVLKKAPEATGKHIEKRKALPEKATGVYRMKLGDFEIIALNDGVVAYHTAEVLPGATPEQIQKSLSSLGLSDPV